MATGELCAV